MLSPEDVQVAQQLVESLAKYNPESDGRERAYSLADVVGITEQLTRFRVNLFDIERGKPYKRLLIIMVKSRVRDLTQAEIDELQPFGRLFSQELASAAIQQLFIAQAIISDVE